MIVINKKGNNITKRHKFVFSEVFNNTNGKTSGSGFIGVIMGLVGCLAFVAAIIGYFLEKPDTIPFMQQTIFFIGSATILLGIRKGITRKMPAVTNNDEITDNNVNDSTEKG